MGPAKQSLFAGFGKAVLQDSTTIRLPDVLSSIFKGNTTNGQQKSQARIQTVINVKTMRFLHFALSGFAQNDQSASGQILDYVGRGHLTIRDLGYFAIETFDEVVQKRRPIF